MVLFRAIIVLLCLVTKQCSLGSAIWTDKSHRRSVALGFLTPSAEGSRTMITLTARTTPTRTTKPKPRISPQALTIVRTYSYPARRMEQPCEQLRVCGLYPKRDRARVSEIFNRKATVMDSKNQARIVKCTLQARHDLSNPCSSPEVRIIAPHLHRFSKTCRTFNSTTTPVGPRALIHHPRNRKCHNAASRSRNVSWASIRMIISNHDRCRCEEMGYSGEGLTIRSNDLRSNMVCGKARLQLQAREGMMGLRHTRNRKRGDGGVSARGGSGLAMGGSREWIEVEEDLDIFTNDSGCI
jgi:hypothetical protein